MIKQYLPQISLINGTCKQSLEWFLFVVEQYSKVKLATGLTQIKDWDPARNLSHDSDEEFELDIRL